MFSRLRLVFFRRDPRCPKDYRSCFENTRCSNRVCEGFTADHPTSAHVRLSIVFISRFHSSAAYIIATAKLRHRFARLWISHRWKLITFRKYPSRIAFVFHRYLSAYSNRRITSHIVVPFYFLSTFLSQSIYISISRFVSQGRA